jgi:hypothetical protein
VNTKRVGVKELRRNLKAFIEGSEAVSIGDHYTIRAILVPVPKHSGYSDSERAKAIRATKKLFAALIAREHPKSGSLLRG